VSAFPNRYEISGQGTADGTNPLVITFGAPPPGRSWDLRSVALMDAASPIATHDATVFVVTPKGHSPTFQPSEVRDVTPCGLPTANHYSRGTIVMGPSESVELWIYSLTASVIITATIQVEEEAAHVG
jgi:hypothetical protein